MPAYRDFWWRTDWRQIEDSRLRRNRRSRQPVGHHAKNQDRRRERRAAFLGLVKARFNDSATVSFAIIVLVRSGIVIRTAREELEGGDLLQFAMDRDGQPEDRHRQDQYSV